MTQVKNFQFAGGRLCLDFANTVDNRRSPQAVDQIDIYEDVIEWTQQAGILSASDAQQIVRASANMPMPGMVSSRLLASFERCCVLIRFSRSIAPIGV